MNSLISIIIPTFNRVSLLGETLDSIIAQTYKNWECLVVDDGSRDRTEELLEFYTELDPRIQFYKRPANRRRGANSCRNYGFEISKGAYINWFDSDDLMHPEKLRTQLNLLLNSSFDFCVSESLSFEGDLSNKLNLRFQNMKSSNLIYDFISMKIGWMTPSALWKRSFLETMEVLFNENLNAAQEWEFHIRILSTSKNYDIISQPLEFIRIHKHNITSDNGLEKHWYYFMARLEVYKNINLDGKSTLFLKNYLVNYFKRTIVAQDLKRSLDCWFKFYIEEYEVSIVKKFAALIAIFSYYLFNKGNYFLQKINY